ncbi:MAG: hypothetical protein CMM46_15315 [Rhodospirillaceae bacterium]|nr:hypothetical protein [Rhodospirillaceae bacterium]|tara:strand:+ start:2406 stop:2681 length:276 start_codon:yes stop_codon:yes gene_type:complete
MAIEERDGRQRLPAAYGSHAYGPCTYHALSPDGGGWGDPFQRLLAEVARDVRDGLVRVEAARQTYGVVVDSDGVIDLPASETLRKGAAVAG